MAEWICPDCGRGPDEKGVCPCGRYGTDVNVMRADALAARVVTLTARVTALETAGEAKFAVYEKLLTAHRLSSSSLADRALTAMEKADAAWDAAKKGGE